MSGWPRGTSAWRRSGCGSRRSAAGLVATPVEPHGLRMTVSVPELTYGTMCP